VVRGKFFFSIPSLFVPVRVVRGKFFFFRSFPFAPVRVVRGKIIWGSLFVVENWGIMVDITGKGGRFLGGEKIIKIKEIV